MTNELTVSKLRDIIGVKETSEQTVTILMAMLHGLTEYTFNGDVIELSIYRAKDICESLDIPKEQVDEILKKFGQFSKTIRKNSPMARALFGGE